ncbi:MAG: DNA recombination protein RmuC [candidate division WOR-3 bacterium]
MAALIISVGALLVAAAVLLVLLGRRHRPSPDQEGLILLQQQLDALRQQTAENLAASTRLLNQTVADLNAQLNQRLSALDRTLQETTGQVNTRLDNAARVIKEVSGSLGELSKASQQIFEVGKDIASLQEILRAPKLRGEISELHLENLLRQVIPNHYETQHQFRSGEKVDAVIRLGPRLVPIDAKLPLDNFKRMVAATSDAERREARRKFIQDFRRHVDAISAKYILPDEGTFDFALMYIMAENVYYETIIRPGPDEESLSDYAIQRRVIPVSPNTLYANLQTIVLGLRGFQIEQRATEIMDRLSRLQNELTRFRETFDTLGTHIGHARSKFEEAAKQLTRLEERLALSAGQSEAPRAAPLTQESEKLPGG